MSEDSSPLTLASPDSLTLLFEVDPLTLSDTQIMIGITELRRRRSEFQSAEAAKALAPKRTKAASSPPTDAAASAVLDKPVSDLSLEDLL